MTDVGSNGNGNGVARRPNGTFPKGVSGNPGGLTKADIQARKNMQEAAQQYTGEALRTMAQIMRKPDLTEADRIRLQTANALLDRGHGKPYVTEYVDQKTDHELRVRWMNDRETAEHDPAEWALQERARAHMRTIDQE